MHEQKTGDRAPQRVVLIERDEVVTEWWKCGRAWNRAYRWERGPGTQFLLEEYGPVTLVENPGC